MKVGDQVFIRDRTVYLLPGLNKEKYLNDNYKLEILERVCGIRKEFGIDAIEGKVWVFRKDQIDISKQKKINVL